MISPLDNNVLKVKDHSLPWRDTTFAMESPLTFRSDGTSLNPGSTNQLNDSGCLTQPLCDVAFL